MTSIRQIPEIDINGFDRSARNAVRLVGDPEEWKVKTKADIMQLTLKYEEISDWLDTDESIIDEVWEKPENPKEAMTWRRGYWAAHTAMVQNIPIAVMACAAVKPYFGDKVMIPLGLILERLKDAFVKILALPRDQDSPPSKRNRPRRVSQEDNEHDRTRKGKARGAPSQPDQPAQRRTTWAPDITGRSTISLSSTEKSQSTRPPTAGQSSTSREIASVPSPAHADPVRPVNQTGQSGSTGSPRIPGLGQAATSAGQTGQRSISYAQAVRPGNAPAGPSRPAGQTARVATAGPSNLPAGRSASAAGQSTRPPPASATGGITRPPPGPAAGQSSLASAGPSRPAGQTARATTAGPSNLAAGRSASAAGQSTRPPPAFTTARITRPPPAGPPIRLNLGSASTAGRQAPPPPASAAGTAARVPSAGPSRTTVPQPRAATAGPSSRPAPLLIQSDSTIALYPPEDHETLSIEQLLATVTRTELVNVGTKSYKSVGICGLCGVDVRGGGHPTKKCKAAHLAYIPGPLISRLDGDTLITNDEENCFQANAWGRCGGTCFAERHQCSLCGGDHEAMFCHPCRPRQVREMIHQVFRDRLLSYSRDLEQRQRTSRIIVNEEPRQWQVVVQAERGQDEEEDVVAGQPHIGMFPLGGEGGRLVWPREQHVEDDDELAEFARQFNTAGRDRPALPDHSRVFASHPNLRLPEGVVNMISLDSFVAACPDPNLGDRVRSVLLEVGRKPTLAQYKQAKTTDDQALLTQNNKVRGLENRLVEQQPDKYQSAHFRQPLAGDHQRQGADGSISAARAHLLPNWPSLHKDSVVLTSSAFSTRLIREYGFSPPVYKRGRWSGDLGLAVWNRVPVKGDASSTEDNLRLRKLEGEERSLPYPSDLVDEYNTHRADFYIRAARRGESKMVLAFGSAQKAFFDRLTEINDDSALPLPFVTWKWTTKSLVNDEFGGSGARTVMMREELMARTQPVFAGFENWPFPNLTSARTEYDTDAGHRGTVELECKLLNSSRGGILFLHVCHPEATSTGFAHEQTVQAFDFAVNFFARAVNNELLGPSLVPTFIASRVDSAKRFEKSCGNDTRFPTASDLLRGKISNKAAVQLVRNLVRHQDNLNLPHDGVRLIVVENLPSHIQALVRRTTLIPVDQAPERMGYFGYEMDLVKRVKLLLHSISGTASGAQPRTDAQLAQLANATLAFQTASSRTLSTEVPSEAESFQAICACGLITTHIRVDPNTRNPVAVSIEISANGAHKPNAEKTQGSCLTGIPVDDELRSRLLVKDKSAKVARPTGDQPAKIARAIARYRDGTAAPAPTEADVEAFRALGRERRAAAIRGAGP